MKWSTGILGVVIGVLALAVIEFRGDETDARRPKVRPSRAAPETASHTVEEGSIADRRFGVPEAESGAVAGMAALVGQEDFDARAVEPVGSPAEQEDATELHRMSGRDTTSTFIEAPPETADIADPVAKVAGAAVPGTNEDDAALDAATLAQSILACMSKEQMEVQADLAEEEGFSRQDLLAMYGRSAAAVGRFAHSAAAYALFLQEYGDGHEYGAEIALRLAESLAPLNIDSVEVDHTRDGPVYHPRWRMRFEPGQRHLRLALPAYELAAELAENEAQAGRALLMRGWVCRALGEWETATAAWDTCASKCPNTEAAYQALRLAAENLEWTGQPAAAAERMRMIADSCTDATRVQRVLARVEDLEAEADRREDWFHDPIASLEAEIAQRAEVVAAPQVYTSVLRWLQRRGQRAFCVEVSLWACRQTDWPVSARINAHYDLVDSLLRGAPSPADRLAAAGVLDKIVALSDENRSALPATLRRCRLLTELGRFEEAKQTLSIMEHRVAGSFEWEPRLLSAEAHILLAQGDQAGARQVLVGIQDSYPDYELTDELSNVLNGTPDEED